MDGSFRIGRLFGIPILIHFTFILIIPIFAWIIANQITSTTDLLQQFFGVPINTSLITAGYMPYILGTVVALGLFAGVLESGRLRHCGWPGKSGRRPPIPRRRLKRPS
jgi:Zn-dependent protease